MTYNESNSFNLKKIKSVIADYKNAYSARIIVYYLTSVGSIIHQLNTILYSTTVFRVAHRKRKGHF